MSTQIPTSDSPWKFYGRLAFWVVVIVAVVAAAYGKLFHDNQRSYKPPTHQYSAL